MTFCVSGGGDNMPRLFFRKALGDATPIILGYIPMGAAYASWGMGAGGTVMFLGQVMVG